MILADKNKLIKRPKQTAKFTASKRGLVTTSAVNYNFFFTKRCFTLHCIIFISNLNYFLREKRLRVVNLRTQKNTLQGTTVTSAYNDNMKYLWSKLLLQ